VASNPEVNFFILPDYIAGEYYAEITGVSEKLVDYYVEVKDNKGNISKSAIQHVWVGPYNGGGGGGGGGQTGVFWTPENPTTADVITITQTDVTQGAKLHWGVKVNGTTWQSPNPVYWPAGSSLFNGTGPAVESPMTGPDGQGNITIQLGPFNNPAQSVQAVDFVLHYNNNTWNNNNGADFHIPITMSTVGLDDSRKDEPLSIWPVPAHDNVYVGVPASFADGYRIRFVSMSGTTVFEENISRENFGLDISHVAKGIYLACVIGKGNECLASRRIIVN
jgi:hypothetical protein